MVTLKARDVLKGLAKKGFSRSEGDHTHLVLYVNGRKTSIRTKVSHGSGEIDDHLIHLMSTQLWLDKEKFINLIHCPLTFDGYLRELEKQGKSFT